MKFKKIFIGIGIILLLIISGFMIFQYRNSQNKEQKKQTLREFRSEKIAFQYPSEYQEQTLPAPQQNHAQTLLKLKLDNPLSYVEFAQEKGAIIGANVTKTNFLDYLEKNAEKNFSINYPQFQKIKSERTEISQHDASTISFSYLGNDQQTTVYIVYIIIPLDNDGYYLTMQSVDQSRLEADLEKIKPTLTIY